MYKTFWDLKFIVREGINLTVSWRSNTIHARLMFNNGYGISVVRGVYNTISYEIAVLGKNDKLDYSTPITNDVEASLTLEQVTEYMIKIQQL